jgi:tetratricopeptide (TPR) repeat protein
MRQNLVLEQEKTPPELVRTFRNLERQSNPWGIGNDQRMAWAEGADVEAAVKAHPEDWRAWLLWAQRHDNDLPALSRAVKLAPDNALVLALLAWAENGAGRRKKAIEYARRANEIAPGRSMHLDTLASLLAGAGKCGEALATERRAIEALPDTAPQEMAGELRARLTQMELKCGRTPSHLDMSEERPDTEPVRKSCSGSLAVAGTVTVTAEYTVREDGSVGEVSVTGKAPQDVLRAFRTFMKSCSYEPATKDGKPVAARMRQDLTVGKR